MTQKLPGTLGDLKKAGWKSRSVKDELRENLIKKIRGRETVFDGIVGYDRTVIPQIQNLIPDGGFEQGLVLSSDDIYQAGPETRQAPCSLTRPVGRPRPSLFRTAWKSLCCPIIACPWSRTWCGTAWARAMSRRASRASRTFLST